MCKIEAVESFACPSEAYGRGPGCAVALFFLILFSEGIKNTESDHVQ